MTVNQGHALQTGVTQGEDDRDGPPANPSAFGVAIGFVRALSLAVWVRFVGAATWGVVGFHVGVALDAAGAPVVGTARAAVSALPVAAPVDTTGAAALLALLLFVLGLLWTLRWTDTLATHRRRLLTLVLLVALPVALSAAEMGIPGAVTGLSDWSVMVPDEPTRALYHVGATFSIAFGAALLWHQLRTGPDRSRHGTHH